MGDGNNLMTAKRKSDIAITPNRQVAERQFVDLYKILNMQELRDEIRLLISMPDDELKEISQQMKS